MMIASSNPYVPMPSTQFFWGSATASYQVEGAVGEGGRGTTVWDTFSHTPGKVDNNDTGDVADDVYHRYSDDIKLMKELGINSYRFSIAWSRIIPDGESTVNAEGVAYYNGVIDELIASDIVPLVTLFHWDTPQTLEDKYGGWLSSEIENSFAYYADTCFDLFGDRVKHWITINEPMSVALNGYYYGSHAPGRCSDRNVCSAGNSSTEPYIVSHNMLNAHAAAVQVYRSKYQRSQKGVIGITLNSDFAYPLTDSKEDADASQRNIEFQAGWYADPVFFGHYPASMVERVGDRLPQFSPEQRNRIKGSHDFYGLNHYTSKYVSNNANPAVLSNGWSDDQGTVVTNTNQDGQLIGPQAASDWLNVVPSGMHDILHWISNRYSNPPILITENGVDVPDESTMPMEQALHDTFRIDYYSSYVDSVKTAMREGVDVRGYFAWSLLDNFEWNNGYNCRFGLTYVDFESNLTRYPKDSFEWYSNYILNDKDN